MEFNSKNNKSYSDMKKEGKKKIWCKKCGGWDWQGIKHLCPDFIK